EHPAHAPARCEDRRHRPDAAPAPGRRGDRPAAHPRVPVERRPVHRPPRRHDRLGAGRRGRAGVLAQLQVPPSAGPADRELPRPGLHGAGGRGAQRARRAPPAPCRPRRQLPEHLAVPALRRQGRERARRALPGDGLLLQDLHQARAPLAALREGAAHVRARRRDHRGRRPRVLRQAPRAPRRRRRRGRPGRDGRRRGRGPGGRVGDARRGGAPARGSPALGRAGRAGAPGRARR
ncbi:MAG: Sarcosine oxidase alpha subunit, partial [uncultured Actinomycetospora sp.]